MILRLWRGWTAKGNAGRYEELIRSTIFPGILGRRIDGLEALELHRRDNGDETEFMTLMRFASWDVVKAFAGPDWEVSVVPPAARAVLARYDERATHYEAVVSAPESPPPVEMRRPGPPSSAIASATPNRVRDAEDCAGGQLC